MGKAKPATQEQPRFVREDRVRKCGMWVDKDYEPTDEEKAIHKRREDIKKHRKAAIAKLAGKK